MFIIDQEIIYQPKFIIETGIKNLICRHLSTRNKLSILVYDHLWHLRSVNASFYLQMLRNTDFYT